MRYLRSAIAGVIFALALMVTVSYGQGPLTNLANLRVRVDSNGYLMLTDNAVGTQGPLTVFSNLRGRTDSNGYLMVTVNNGTTAASSNWSGATWTDVTYDSDNFTTNGSMTWTVASGDQKMYQYLVIGKMMTLIFDIQTTTVGGTPSTNLRIAIPGGYTAATTNGSFIQANWIIDNGTQRTSVISIDSGGSVVNCWPSETTGNTNWTASTDNTRVAGVLTFEVA